MRYQNLFSLSIGLLFVGIIMGATWVNREPAEWNSDTYVADVLHALGEPLPDHRPSDLSEENIGRGKSLVFTGYAVSPDGKRSRVQSRYFVCTNCHLMEREDPDLRISDPEARLDFLLGRNLPFLQGTTMYGTVNKQSWYNDDYEKKYGSLVKPARHSLKGAIDLCSTVCSQGRPLEDWERDAMLAYFWSISLRLGDLNLGQDDWKKLAQLQASGRPDAEAVKWLRSFFLQGSPATFLDAPEDKHRGYEVAAKGDPAKGAQLFTRGCLSCHGPEGASKYLKLDSGKLSLDMFRNRIASHGYFSLYEIVRHGTYATQGHRPYMPHYTAERMSNQQVEDMRAFVESRGNY